jgi:hypothetical protein
LGAILGAPLSLVAVETVKKNPAFVALVAHVKTLPIMTPPKKPPSQ